jgi:hypothetical protein
MFVEGLKYLRDEKESSNTCVYYTASTIFCEYSCRSAKKNILLHLSCRKHHCPNTNVKVSILCKISNVISHLFCTEKKVILSQTPYWHMLYTL